MNRTAIHRGSVGPAFALQGIVLAAGWVAAGSVGFLGNAFGRALVLLAAVAVCVAGWPRDQASWRKCGSLLLSFFAAVAAVASGGRVPMVFALALLIMAVARVSEAGGDRDAGDMAWAGACALSALGVFRLLAASLAAVWFLADGSAALLSRTVALVTGLPARFGSTFAGADLVLVAFIWCLCFGVRRRAGWSGLARGAIAVLAAHGLYLVLAAGGPVVVAKFAGRVDGPVAAAACAIIPWYLPAVGAGIHLAVLAFLAMRALRRPVPPEPYAGARRGLLGLFLARGLAALLSIGAAALLFVNPSLPSPSGKKVVLFEKGYLNWNSPVHGEYGAYSAGMYGNLPDLIRSIGAEACVAPEISPDALADADALVLIYPVDPWTEEEKRCIWEFVRLGGSLLLMGEHTAMCDDGGNRFDEILEPTAIRVNFDSAYFLIGGWLESYETLAHPVLNGCGNTGNPFGIVVGASLSVAPPARPLVVGKWGYSDQGHPGGEAGMGNVQPDPGERLGDVVLMAEQRLGSGRVVVFGDTSSLCNSIAMGCEPFLSRLFAYLCCGAPDSAGLWRQTAALMLAVALLGVLAISRDGCAFGIAALLLGAMPPAFTSISSHRFNPMPVRGACEKPIAYIDASHNNAFSAESWRPDGIMGFVLTLARNGFLPFTLERFDERRLRQADVLVMVAPQRRLSARESGLVEELVARGMLLILAVGYEQRDAAGLLLERLGLGFDDLRGCGEAFPGGSGRSVPLGFFKSPYLDDGGVLRHVRFHAAWPVRCAFDDAEVLARGYWDMPVMVLRRCGKGAILFVGDGAFIQNRNLENEDGAPFEGERENADFWRWFFSGMSGGAGWVRSGSEATGSGSGAATGVLP